MFSPRLYFAAVFLISAALAARFFDPERYFCAAPVLGSLRVLRNLRVTTRHIFLPPFLVPFLDFFLEP